MCVFNQVCVCGRSSRWPSSRSSGWRTGRWSTSWSREFDSPNRSSARLPSTPCSPTAGPTSRTTGPASASSSAPWGTHSHICAHTHVFLPLCYCCTQHLTYLKFPSISTQLNAFSLVRSPCQLVQTFTSKTPLHTLMHTLMSAFVCLTARSTGWSWSRRWVGGGKEHGPSHQYVPLTTQSLHPRYYTHTPR